MRATPGREGELIFRNIIRATDAKQPIKRLWLQTMTPDVDPRRHSRHLRSDEEMRPLADAAVSRSEADWLVGINSTRALTAFNSHGGGFQKTTAGRVQTPTLAILVEREEKIRAFVPRAYFEVFGDFDVAGGQYRGRWFDEKFDGEESGGRAGQGRAHLGKGAGGSASTRNARASRASSRRRRSRRRRFRRCFTT